MSVIVYKTADTIVLCPNGMLDAINADFTTNGFSQVCEIVTVDAEVNCSITFDTAVTPGSAEDLVLDDIMDNWDNSLCSNGTDPGGVEFDAGLQVQNDDTPLVGDVDILNFKGTVAATTPEPGKADIHVGSIEVKNVDTIALIRTDPVYAVSTDLNGVLEVIRAEADDPLRMPAIGVLEQDLAIGATGLCIFSGEIKNVNTLGFAVGDEIWVAPGGSGTNIKPTGKDNKIQKIAQILKADAIGNTGSALIYGAGRTNDIPNMEDGHVWLGDVNDVPTPYLLEPGLIKQATATIAPGATTTVISFAPTLNAGTKYIISVVDTVTGEVAVSEVLGSYKALGDVVTHNHYGRIGDRIKYKPSLSYSSPNVNFDVKNNDTNPITVSVTRIQMLSA